MQSDTDSMFEVVSTADWLHLQARHAPGQEGQLRYPPHLHKLSPCVRQN